MFSEASGASLNHLQEEAHKCNSDNHKYPYCVIESHKPISPRAYCVSSPPYCAEESYKPLHLYPYSVSSRAYCIHSPQQYSVLIHCPRRGHTMLNRG